MELADDLSENTQLSDGDTGFQHLENVNRLNIMGDPSLKAGIQTYEPLWEKSKTKNGAFLIAFHFALMYLMQQII